MRRDERQEVKPCPLKENHRCNWQKAKCILTKLLIIPFLIYELNFMSMQRCDRFNLLCRKKSDLVSISFHNVEPHIKTHSISAWLQIKTASLGGKIIETCYMQATPHPVLTERQQECSYSWAKRSTFIYLETRGSEKDLLQNNMDITCNMDTLTDMSPSCSHKTVSVRFREGLQGWNKCPDFYLGIFQKWNTQNSSHFKIQATSNCKECVLGETYKEVTHSVYAWSIISLCRMSHMGFVNASRGFVCVVWHVKCLVMSVVLNKA